MGERAHIEAGSGGELQQGHASIQMEKAQVVDSDHDRLQRDRARGARECVSATSTDLLGRKRRRTLQERAAETLEHPIERTANRLRPVSRTRSAPPRRRTCRWPSRTARVLRTSSSRSFKNWASLVALPMRSGRTPVARGSSVPVCPTFAPASTRRTAATTSCDEGPDGLSTTRTPSAAGVAAWVIVPARAPVLAPSPARWPQ